MPCAGAMGEVGEVELFDFEKRARLTFDRAKARELQVSPSDDLRAHAFGDALVSRERLTSATALTVLPVEGPSRFAVSTLLKEQPAMTESPTQLRHGAPRCASHASISDRRQRLR